MTLGVATPELRWWDEPARHLLTFANERHQLATMLGLDEWYWPSFRRASIPLLVLSPWALWKLSRDQRWPAVLLGLLMAFQICGYLHPAFAAARTVLGWVNARFFALLPTLAAMLVARIWRRPIAQRLQAAYFVAASAFSIGCYAKFMIAERRVPATRAHRRCRRTCARPRRTQRARRRSAAAGHGRGAAASRRRLARHTVAASVPRRDALLGTWHERGGPSPSLVHERIRAARRPPARAAAPRDHRRPEQNRGQSAAVLLPRLQVSERARVRLTGARSAASRSTIANCRPCSSRHRASGQLASGPAAPRM